MPLPTQLVQSTALYTLKYAAIRTWIAPEAALTA